ncbi:MAG: IreB family regulatory phosphoprotein [Peptococcaceae bacterium]|nr:IreB family regulatory phosphoprotein [Peptococcaceae bacterium]
MDETMMFHTNNEGGSAREILQEIHAALLDKGYDPINQLVGYLMSGDPVYITSHAQARTKIRKIERYELLEELVRHYLSSLEREIGEG